MKKIIFFLLVAVLMSGCKTNEGNSPEFQEVNPPQRLQQNIFNVPYLTHTDFEVFKDFEKVTDTLIYDNKFHPQFSLLQIKKDNKNILFFNKLSIDENEGLVENTEGYDREILDSIHINNLNENEIIISGCCEVDKKYGEETIAVVEKSDVLYVDKVIRAWRANLETGKIEEIFDLEKVKCMNKNYKVELPISDF